MRFHERGDHLDFRARTGASRAACQSKPHDSYTPSGDAIVSGGVPAQIVYLSESSSSLLTGRK